MNSLERILATLKGETPDRTPVMPQMFAHTAVICGKSIHDYVESGEVAAKCQLGALARYGADSVFAALDVCVEAAAVGCQISYPQNIYPAVTKPAFDQGTDFARLVVPDPEQAARMPEVLAMARRLRKGVGDEQIVVGVVQGPMTLAFQFLGAETALFLAADEPDRFEQLLDFNTEVAIRFGLAQLAAGAHVTLVFEPAGCPEVVPVGFFREFLAPRITKIFAAYRAGGAPANWLHIAGQSLGILPLYRNLGADIGNFDYVVDPARLIRDVPQELCLDGNIKPLSFVEAEPEEIEVEARRLINLFRKRGRFILSSGCEIPPEARPENIQALVRAASRPPCQRISDLMRI
jgi:uroporphyrinogen decarboxylase